MSPLTLDRHAAETVDMAPHTATLTRMASHALRAVEFGVRTGVSSWAILDGLPCDGTLVSVDTQRHTAPERVACDPRWTFLLCDSLDSGPRLPDPIDLALVDSSHEYHQTLRELELLARLHARTVLLHDWELPDVRDAVRGFCERTGYRVVMIEPSHWGLVGIERP